MSCLDNDNNMENKRAKNMRYLIILLHNSIRKACHNTIVKSQQIQAR